MNDFSQSTEISDKIRKLLREKNDYRKQLVALQKKEAKSAWYSHREPKKVTSGCSNSQKKSDECRFSGVIRVAFQTMKESQEEQSGKEHDELQSDRSS